MQSFIGSVWTIDVGDVRPLGADALLDPARARVRLAERRLAADREREVGDEARRRCGGSAARAAAGRSRRERSARRARSPRDVVRRRFPPPPPPSGSRCVWTETTSGTSSRIACSTSSAIACASSSERSAGSLRWSESSVPVASGDGGDVVHLAHARHAERGRVRALAHGADRLRPARRGRRRPPPAARSARRARPRRRRRAPGAAPRRRETPITTSANLRPAAWRIRRRRSSTGGSIASIAWRAASSASAGARSMSTSMLRRMRRPAAPRTSTATKSAATASPFGWPARARSSPTRTANEPARSLAKWSAFEASAALW